MAVPQSLKTGADMYFAVNVSGRVNHLRLCRCNTGSAVCRCGSEYDINLVEWGMNMMHVPMHHVDECLARGVIHRNAAYVTGDEPVVLAIVDRLPEALLNRVSLHRCQTFAGQGWQALPGDRNVRQALRPAEGHTVARAAPEQLDEGQIEQRPPARRVPPAFRKRDFAQVKPVVV